MSRIRVKRDRKPKIESTAIERICAALLQQEAAEVRSSRVRLLWGLLVGVSSLALGLYHPAMAQDEPGRDRQPPREPERGFGPWNKFPAIKPEPDPLDNALWPDHRRRNLMGPARLMAQQDISATPKQHFEIPPGELRPALSAFSRQTDLQLLYLSELADGRTTQGLQGDYTPEEGLKGLLAGTGLAAFFSDAGTVTLQLAGVQGAVAPGMAQASEETKPVKVPEVVVKEKKEFALAVDSPDGYKADVSSEAVLRFPAKIQELPMSVGIVTQDSIRERRAVTQEQAIEGVAGISKTPQFGALSAGDFVIRGFETVNRAPGYTRDNGLSAFNNYVADPTLYERIEVIKGPASFTSGLVTAGGFVNRLLKSPLNENFVVAEAGGGSHGHYRTTLDANGVLPDLPIAGRFVFTQNEDPEFFRNTGNRRYSFLPSVRFATDNDFTLTVTGNVQHLRGKGNYGTPTNTQGMIPAGIEDSLLGNDNQLKIDYRSLHVEADKRFAQGFRLKAKGQYSKDESSYRYAYGYQAGGIGPDGNFSIYGLGVDFKRESFAGEVNLIKEFSLFGNLSSVAAGVDLSHGRFLQKGAGFLSLGAGNIASPNVNVPFPPGFTDSAEIFGADHRFQQTGAFGQALLRPFAGTTLMVALRGNWIAQEGEAVNFIGGAGNVRGLNESRLTPQIGLSQRLIDGLNVYASYGESIQPNFAVTANGSLLDPITGKTVEVGSKWEPLGGRIRLTAAFFRTLLDNVAIPDPAFPPNARISIGGQEQRNQGFEFEARGALLPELQVNLAYTFLETEITKSLVPGVVGAEAFNAPAHTVSAFGSYDLSNVLTKGLKLGAVVYYRSEVASFPFPEFRGQTFEGYTRADLFALYAPLPWLSFQVNLNNIADARYVEGPNSYRAYNHFGAPRHVIGMLRLTF